MNPKVHPLNVAAPVVISIGSMIASERLTMVPFLARVLVLGAIAGFVMYGALKYIAHASAKREDGYRVSPRPVLVSWLAASIALAIMLVDHRVASFFSH